MLDNEEFSDYTTKVLVMKRDIVGQMVGFKNSTGDVADCYKKIILDKLWKLNRIVGEHYLKCLGAIAEVEADVADPNPLSQTRYAMEEMTKLLDEAKLSEPTPLDSPSVVIRSVPSLPHQTSLS